MATTKISATLDCDVLDEIRRTVGAGQLSAFLSTAAREKLQRARILAYLDDLDAKHGPVGGPAEKIATKRISSVLSR